MMKLATLGLCLLLVSLTGVLADNECDGSYRGGLYMMAINLPAQILGEFDDIDDEKQCFQECCKLVKSGCNAVSFLNVEESPFCLLANCTPFHACTWAPSSIASVFRILKAEVNIPVENQTDWTVTNATTNATAGNRTLPGNAIPELNITEDQGAWNIFTDKPADASYVTSTKDPFWESLEKEEDHEESEEGARGNYNFGLTQAPDTSDDAPDQASQMDGGRPLGPGQLYQYMNTPAIAIAVCIGVVLLLLLLLVAGKRLVVARKKAQYNKLQDQESEKLTRNAPDHYYDDA